MERLKTPHSFVIPILWVGLDNTTREITLQMLLQLYMYMQNTVWQASL